MSVSIRFDEFDMNKVLDVFDKIEHEAEQARFWDGAGALITKQTVKRIADEKRAPDGSPWQSLNALYETSKSQSSSGGMLEYEGNLRDSIHHNSSSTSTEVGSALVYAPVHHFGAVIKPKKRKSLAFRLAKAAVSVTQINIPARPFLGLSDKNVLELKAYVIKRWSDHAKS